VSPRVLEIHELAAWGFDHETDRPSLARDVIRIAARKAQHKPHQAESPVSIVHPRNLARMLAFRSQSVTASGEFDGLAWEPAIVDLRGLIAFQRRIGFSGSKSLAVGHPATWQQLLDLALPLTRDQPSDLVSITADGRALTLRTLSPNLTIRFARVSEGGRLPSVRLVANSGSPYIEVASYQGRWFLRDGYHRAFLLLKHGIFHVPAVVVHADSFAQVGATGKQFFAKEILFSGRPPMVTDFLDEEIAVCYLRPRRQRVMRVSIQELLNPVQAGCEEEVL
jgi:hypothetical protein